MHTGSRHARLSLALTLVLVAGLGGCATGGGSAGDAFSEEATRALEIEVLNLNFADATLWIQRGNERIRLGTVTGKTEDKFSLAWPYSYETTITIDLVHGPSEPANDLELPDNAEKIRINQTFLQVDETSGITWVVSDLQDMFFRPGDATLGEDENLWFLIEWRDIPSTTAPGIRTDPLGAESATASRFPSSWGALKARPLADE